MKHLSIRAVAIGVLVDLAGSVATGVALGIFVAIIAASTHTLSPEHMAALRNTFSVKLLGLVGTTFFTGLGGYVAARKTLPNGLVNSLAVGLVSLCLGISLAILVPGVTPLWKLIAGVILTVPAACVGGYVASRPVSPGRI
jgi:hypothetical protein